MDRQTLGKKISENLAIQGQIESAKSNLFTLKSEKAEADALVAQGIEAKKASDKLGKEIDKLSVDLKSLENELSQSDSELGAANAKVPRLINENKGTPTHIRL